MDWQTWFKKILTMKVFAFVLPWCLVAGFQSHATTMVSEVTLSETPLTTDAILKLDPTEENPALRQWVLQKEILPVGLAAFQKKTGGFGAELSHLHVKLTRYFRSAAANADFVKTACLNDLQKLAEDISMAYLDNLQRKQEDLFITLKRLSAPDEKTALYLALVEIKNWMERRQDEYQSIEHRMSAKTVFSKTWLGDTLVCPDFAGIVGKGSANTGTPQKSVVRAPVKRMEGTPVVRLSVDSGGVRLNGSFLIDIEQKNSLVSPDFLRFQGLVLDRVLNKKRNSIKLRYLNRPQVGYPVSFDRIELSGFVLPVVDFYGIYTEHFLPPKHLEACCDGVIGRDFLRAFAVEVRQTPRPEIVFYPSKNFYADHFSVPESLQRKDQYRPIGVFVNSGGKLVTDCRLEKEGKKVERLGWSTLSPVEIALHKPWNLVLQQHLKKNLAQSWNCAGTTFESVRWDFLGAENVANPAGTIGLNFLARGNFILDLGNNRIWLNQDFFQVPGIPRQDLKLVFVNEPKDGRRYLKVLTLSPNGIAGDAFLKGLRPGMELTALNGQPPSKVDSWELEQIISGRRGPKVELTWKEKNREKTALVDLSGSAKSAE